MPENKNKTIVVNLYKEKYDTYVGRAGKGQDGTFGNPYTGPDRDGNIEKFKDYFYKRIKTDKEFHKKVLELKGKRLGCFCSPKKCHADIIADYLNNLPEVKKLKLAVIGSRSFVDYDYMCGILKWFDIHQIISGGAQGADLLAKQYAKENKILYKEFPPDWNKYGKSAGYIRNKQIIDAADEVAAFWDGISKGTKHSLDIAEENGKPVHIFTPMIWKDDLAQLG